MAEKNSNEISNPIYDITNNPQEYINKVEKNFTKLKEQTKQEIKKYLPDSMKFLMEDGTGDLVLTVIAIILLTVILKVLKFTIRIIIQILLTVSIFIAAYILYKHFFGG